MKKIITLFIVFVFFTGALAQPQQANLPVVVIRAGRVFDSENGAFLPARDIIVRGNLIESVGENLPVPAGARVIDLRRYTVLPGL